MLSVPVKNILSRRIIFITGKGGVGKTVVSQAIARALASTGLRTLWITFEDPLLPPGHLKETAPNFFHLNANATVAFEEYAGMKIGSSAISRIFVKNKLIQYLAQAAPGLHELVLLGKLWYERNNYDRVVADLPATGHGLAMFQSTRNFSVLFQGGPIHRDAIAMMKTFEDPEQSGQLLIALPEEMPLREALELNDFLKEMFPANPSGFIVNRLFPKTATADPSVADPPSKWPSPIAKSARDYIAKRSILEDVNLRLWRERSLSYAELPFIVTPPTAPTESLQQLVALELSRALLKKGYIQ